MFEEVQKLKLEYLRMGLAPEDALAAAKNEYNVKKEFAASNVKNGRKRSQKTSSDIVIKSPVARAGRKRKAS